MKNGVPVGIKKLLVVSGLKEPYPRVVFISCYQAGQPFVGISHAVKFRLFNPSIPIIFFSFYSKGQLHSQDTFGVLALEGTVFVQLPCCKEKLVQAANKYGNVSLNIDSAKWQRFSQNACKHLLKQRLAELKHGNKFDLGNRVLNPLRIACINAQASSQDISTLSLIQAKLLALKKYRELPRITKLLTLARVCQNTNDDFLKTAKKFATLFTELAEWNTQLDKGDINKLLPMIDRLNDTFKRVKSF